MKRNYREPQALLMRLGRQAAAQLPRNNSLAEVRDALGFRSHQAADLFATRTLGRVVLRLRQQLRNAEMRVTKTSR